MSQRNYTATIYGRPRITRRSARALFRALVEAGAVPAWIDRTEHKGGWTHLTWSFDLDEWQRCVRRAIGREARKAGQP